MREDWIEATLDEVISEDGVFKDGDWVESKDQDPNGEVRLIQLADIGDGVFLNKSNRYLTKIKATELNCTFLKEGDLIIARMPHPLGRATIFPLKGHEKYVTVVDVAIIRFENTSILTKFFLYNINSPNSRRKIEELQSGTTRKRISRKNLATITFPLAPLPEQRAIVNKIEKLFSELDNGINNLKKAKEKLEIYRQAVLKKAFEGELTKGWREKNLYKMDIFLDDLKKEKEEAIKSKLISNSNYFPEYKEDELIYKIPDNWVCIPWKTITSNNKYAMKRGPFGSSLKKEFFVDQGIVVYEQGHAINDDPYRHRYFITEEKFKELKAFEVKGGDMIISCSGVTLGRICLLPDDADLGIINQALLKIDLDEKIMLKKYFILLFRSESFQRLIFEKSLGTAMPNMVGMTELKEIPIPIPSIHEQQQIINEIEARLSVCDNILTNIDEGLEKAEALRQSIIKKAFEGRLLNNEELEACRKESDWEPAEKLLDRIKNEKK